jgi:hypothetical protein
MMPKVGPRVRIHFAPAVSPLRTRLPRILFGEAGLWSYLRCARTPRRRFPRLPRKRRLGSAPACWYRCALRGARGRFNQYSARREEAPSLDLRPRSGYARRESRTQRRFLIQIGAAAADYRTGEKAVGTSSLFSCRIGRTPLCGGHTPPGLRDSSRMRAREDCAPVQCWCVLDHA